LIVFSMRIVAADESLSASLRFRSSVPDPTRVAPGCLDAYLSDIDERDIHQRQFASGRET